MHTCVGVLSQSPAFVDAQEMFKVAGLDVYVASDEEDDVPAAHVAGKRRWPSRGLRVDICCLHLSCRAPLRNATARVFSHPHHSPYPVGSCCPLCPCAPGEMNQREAIRRGESGGPREGGCGCRGASSRKVKRLSGGA